MDTTIHLFKQESPLLNDQPVGRYCLLACIILAHIGLLYGLRQGFHAPLPVAPAQSPREVMVSLISLPASSAVTPPKTQQRLAPKNVPMVKKSSTPKPVTAPVVKKAPAPQTFAPPINTMPSEQAITVDSAPPAKTEPVPPTAEPATESSSKKNDAPAAAPSSETSPRAGNPGTKTVSGADFITYPQLDYPPISRRLQEEGKVVLKITINTRGRAEKAEIIKSSGYDRLDEAARKAVLTTAVFKPHTENGIPITIVTTLPLSFKLNENED